ncbi:HAD family phosphatase [Mucilaginibacter terrenus]|uniref:Beta-phosphoglucomutase n=1 Tax=Mucilaginibacter terrenus TaxID=2482727 RepID=A0A3E2NY60_9SPHI|nr:HAD family phosphatase [Mucilaginibacter terrenus]RFZ85922.1 HAD family phosphatase [Mucilaginibacter terrenus]
MSENQALHYNTPSTEENLKGVAAIFDMDGTLIDNTPFHFKAWQQVFEKYGLPALTKETYQGEISGVPIPNTVEKFFAQVQGAAPDLIAEEKQHLYQVAFKPYLQPINGLENFLAELKDSGMKIALATSSSMADVDFIFNGISIRQYFDVIVTGNMVSKPKPNPQIFLKAAEQLHALPEKCLVFEDSTAGLKAGHDAGMKVVGITTAHAAEKIKQVANLVINDYAGLKLQELAVLFDDK